MSWEDQEPLQRPCPCGAGRYIVESRSDDWGRFDERWAIQCRPCAEKYGLFREAYNRKGVYETSFSWVSHDLLQKIAEAKLKREESERRLTSEATQAFGERWYAHFEGKAKKTIWSELTEQGKFYPSLGTFYEQVRTSGLRSVLSRYFDRRQLPTVIRILGSCAAALVESMADVEQVERDLEARIFIARQQAYR